MALLSLLVKRTPALAVLQEDSATEVYHSRNTEKIVGCCSSTLPIVL
jgi:hypothetical protein